MEKPWKHKYNGAEQNGKCIKEKLKSMKEKLDKLSSIELMDIQDESGRRGVDWVYIA